jgi:hypothetical protein
MADDSPRRTSTDEQPVTNGFLHGEMLAYFRRQLGGNLIVAAIAVGGATLGAWKAVASEARQQADAGVLPVRVEVDDLGRRVKRVELEIGDLEVQADIRALYRFQRTGEPQPRLETPRDAGRPDGG